VSRRLAGSGLVLSACVAFWARTGDQTHDIHRYLAVYAIAFAAYLVALRPGPLSPRAMRLVLGAALGWRVALIAAPPLLSDDANRYVWEGRIQAHGGNPYAWGDRPEAEKWAPLRDSVWQGVNHKGYTAIYPPLWQLAARAVVAVSDSVTAMKTFLVACEALAMLALAAALRRRELPPERLLVLAWNPLALVEIAGSGHNEAAGLVCLALALWALDAQRPLLVALVCAAGFSVKLLPGVVGASWVRRYRPAQVLVALAVAILPVLPFVGAGEGLWRSLRAYAAYWQFNETLFAPLAAALGREVAQVVCLGGLALLVAALAWYQPEPATAGLAIVGAWLLLSANVLPWYALWLVPFLVLRDCAPLLAFNGTIALAYLVYPLWLAGGAWHVSWGVRALEYGPCALLGLFQLERWAAARGLLRWRRCASASSIPASAA
jgi:hypothetical protein